MRGGALAPVGLALLVAAGAIGMALSLAAESTLVSYGVLGALGLSAYLLWARGAKRLAIAGLFFLAPIDVSKAIVAPDTEFYSPGLYLSPAHAVLLVLFAGWVVRRTLVERRLPPMTALDALALAWLGWIWVRAVGSAQGTLALATAVSYSLAVLGFYAVSHLLTDVADLRAALKASVWVLLLETLFVAAQMAAHYPFALPGSKAIPFASTLTFGGEGLAFRPSGFVTNPNGLADHLTIVLGPALAFTLLGARRVGARVWLVALAVLVAAGVMLLLTLSRGGWVAFAVGSLFTVAVYASKRILTLRQLSAAGLSLALLSLAFVSVYPQVLLRLTASDDRSVESRVILSDQALTIIRANPWLGVGYGDYNRAANEYWPPSWGGISADYQKEILEVVVHDHYLLLAAELGLPAMLFFVFVMWRFIRLPFPLQRWQEPGRFGLAVGLSSTMVSQFVYLSADNYYADTRIFMLWLCAGLLQALVLAQRGDEPVATARQPVALA